MPPFPRSRRSYWLGGIAFVVAIAGVTPRPARADVTAAARAFAQGQAAQLEGNYAFAAEQFELAFALQPSKEALRSAARMQLSAQNFARAATHAQTLLDSFGEDEPSTALARSILDEVAPRLARYEVICTPECALAVDHLAYFVDPAPRHRLYLRPGPVVLEAHFASGRSAARSVTTGAGEAARIELEMPAPPPPASPARDAAARAPSRRVPTPGAEQPSERRAGLPAAVPWLTGVATVACGGLTLWAALDTQRQHDEYLQHPTREKWNDGVARQSMTNVLAASTAALGVATITLAFFVRGSSKASVGVTPALGPRSASMAVTGSF